MNQKTLLMAGYGAALAGFGVYFFTRETAGMMLGGLLLCVTSLYKIVSDRKKGGPKDR